MVNWTAVLLAAAWMDAPPARLIPPIAPSDLAELIAKDPTADPEAAKRMLAENGVPLDRRRAAANALRGAGSAHAVVIEAIVTCAGTCGATRDLDDLLVSMAAEVAVDPAAIAHLATAANDPTSPLRLAALRTIAAMPEAARPEAVRGAVVRTIRLKAIPGAMKYDVTDVKAAPGEVLEFILENPDTMQHNLLIVAPGKMPEVGVAGDKMGETAAGKARQFVPDLPSVLAAMGLVDPGATGRVHWVAPTKTGTYPYVCTYPGHWRMMNGKIKVTAPAPK